MSLIWLASYPKTGSNWVRRIVRGLLSPERSPSDAIPSVRHEISEFAPSYTVRGEQVSIFKTHCHPSRVIHLGALSGLIIVKRHPIDVLLSYLNYAKFKNNTAAFRDGKVTSVEKIIESGDINYYIDSFIDNDGIAEYRKICGSFQNYVPNWRRAAQGKPTFIFDYEVMIEDEVEAVRKLAKFLQVKCDSRLIADHISAQTTVDGNFNWKKRPWNFTHMLNQETIRNFEDRAKNFLKSCRYHRHTATATKALLCTALLENFTGLLACGEPVFIGAF
jgi:hypothetical protein